MKDIINFDDFLKLDIKIGTIREVVEIESSDRLLKLMVDVGEESLRQIVSGIKVYYPDFKVLIGKQVPVLVNLAPRKFMGVESQGMILMAEDNDTSYQLHPEKEIENGTCIR